MEEVIRVLAPRGVAYVKSGETWKKTTKPWPDETLLLAGPPERAELRTAELTLQNPDEAEAAFQGRHGATLCLVNATDGKSLAQYELESPPVFDGMIAARGQVFISLEDDSLVCHGR